MRNSSLAKSASAFTVSHHARVKSPWFVDVDADDNSEVDSTVEGMDDNGEEKDEEERRVDVDVDVDVLADEGENGDTALFPANRV